MGKAASFVACLAVAAAVAACTSGPPPPDDSRVRQSYEEWRDARERLFRDGPDSPIPENKKASLLPIQYYPVDPSFIVPAELKLSDERPVFTMPTSTGTQRRYQLVGTLEFRLQGQPMSLGAFVPAGEEIATLFVPFADETSRSQETYPAGRYLDVEPTSTGIYSIDFNRAYNPYCAYNLAYECPYPPPSNQLKIAVRVGEKKPPA
jgi:uncharacterized protein (DUF1684 family)